MRSQSIGQVGYVGKRQEVTIPKAVLLLGCAAAGTYVGFQVGGPYGAAIGALVGTFIGGFAAGFIRKCKIIIKPDGEVQVKFKTIFD